MTIKFVGMLLAATVGTASFAQTPPPPPPPEAKTSAKPYVMAAGMSDLYEINSSKVALQKSQTPAIRQFATMLIKHHQKTTAATVKALLDAGATASINELQTASAADFDRLYVGQQVPAHQAALDLHQSYSSGGDQAPLRMSAKAAVPIVKQHLDAAMKMQAGKPMANMSGM
jgi:putative membrane protein